MTNKWGKAFASIKCYASNKKLKEYKYISNDRI